MIDGWKQKLDKVVQQTVAQSLVDNARGERRRWGIWRMECRFTAGKDTQLALTNSGIRNETRLAR